MVSNNRIAAVQFIVCLRLLAAVKTYGNRLRVVKDCRHSSRTPERATAPGWKMQRNGLSSLDPGRRMKIRAYPLAANQSFSFWRSAHKDQRITLSMQHIFRRER